MEIHIVSSASDNIQILYEIARLVGIDQSVVKGKIYIHKDGKFFLKSGIKKFRSNLYLVDIAEEKDFNMVLNHIRQHNSLPIIVFFSRDINNINDDKSILLLRKSLIKKEYLSNVLLSINKLILKNINLFILETSTVKFKLPFENILYFSTTYGHRVELVSEALHKEFIFTLKNIVKIDRRLVRCHRSYVVNLDNVLMLNKSQREFTMKNGSLIPISRKYFDEILDLF